MPELFEAREGRAEAPARNEVDGLSWAALEESYLDYRLLFEASADGMLLASFDEAILDANLGACCVPRRTREQVISAGLDGLFDPSDPRLESAREEQRKTGGFKGVLRLLRGDGTSFPAEVSTTVYWGNGGEERVGVVFRDITEYKQAEVEKRLQDSLNVLVALHEAGRVLGSTLELEEIGTRLLEIMRRVSNLSAAVANLRDEHGRLRVLHALGPESLRRSVSSLPEAQAARRMALEREEHRLFRVWQPEEGGVPLVGLCLPLRVRDRVIGVLEAYGPEVLAEKATIETLESLTSQAASALENARLYGELAKRERRLHYLVGKLLVAQEEERRRIAYEMHDGLTQVAIATHQTLQAFTRDHPPDSASSRRQLHRTLELARQTVGEARRVIADLRPTTLDDFGLATAIRLRVERLRAQGWEIGYDETLGNERLSPEIETALYRVAREALTNVRKHARTTRAHIMLARRGKKVCLEVRDQGCGFDQSTPSEKDPGQQVGLCSMRERITLLGGDFTIHSRPGAGTSVVAEVPLPVSEEVNDHAR